jgi:hypothetical protein
MKLNPSLLFGMAAALMTSVVDGKLDAVQTYYVPLPESDLYDFFESISSETSGPITTTISIAIAASNTIIHYDHWEDPGNPQIWGDGVIENGSPPGVPDDILIGGTAILLENDVPLPRLTTVLYDGRDRIQSSLPIAVTRSAYPANPGALLAGAVEGTSKRTSKTRFLIASISTTHIHIILIPRTFSSRPNSV